MSQNVVWDPEFGGTCPQCQATKIAVTSSPPWVEGIKIRFHRCPQCGCTFKSIQVKHSAPANTNLQEIAEQIKAIEEEVDRLNRILNYS